MSSRQDAIPWRSDAGRNQGIARTESRSASWSPMRPSVPAIGLRGADVDELRRISSQVVDFMQSIKGVVDIALSLGDPRPEYRIDVNRDIANEVGLDVTGVAATVRPILAGETVTRREDPNGEEHDVTLQVAASGRPSVPDLGAWPLAANR